jgi:hypothetical protein
MPLTDTQAALLSNDSLLKGLLENDPKRIQLAGLMPFYATSGDRLTIPRVTAANLGTAIWDTGGIAIADTSAIPSSPNIAFPLKLLVTSFRVNGTAELDMSNVNDQVEIQILAAVKRMIYQFWATFNTGNASANPQEFDGLRRLAVSGQTITARGGSGGTPSLSELDQLVGLVKGNGGHPSVLYTSRKGFEAIRRAHWKQGITPETIDVPVADGRTGSPTSKIMAFNGLPILVDDNVPNDETANNYTSIYALVLGRGDGVYGIIPEQCKTEMIRAAKTLVDGKGQDTYVVYWPVSIALESETGIARMQQVG